MTCGLCTYINISFTDFGLPSSAGSKSPYTCITLYVIALSGIVFLKKNCNVTLSTLLTSVI